MKLFLPTRVYFENNCIKKYKDEFKIGRKALIVTGKASAKKSGALLDVISVLREQSIDYAIFDRVENNPTPENCYEGGQTAKREKVDFIIGIGGGSPLDAAKAIALYATNDLSVLDIYDKAKNSPLPIIAIPTTAGTGSEVTPYSVLTISSENTKKTVKRDDIFPSVAFLDANYTKSLPKSITQNTGLDALSHALESILCKNSSDISEMFAKEAITYLSKGLLEEYEKDSARENMLYGSMLAGCAIAHSGTTIVHLLGYPLTCVLDIPHGLANGYLLVPFLKLIKKHIPEKFKNISACFNNAEDIIGYIEALLPAPLELSGEHIDMFVKMATENPKLKTAIWDITEKEVREIYGAI